jgi:aspartate carbamoyltransferase catalytic subunit
MTDARFPHRHLLGIQGLGPQEITTLLDLADGYVEQNRSLD